MPLTIDVYSDVICPWCYVGKKNLEKALEALPVKADLRVRYRPFELNPGTPEAGIDRKAYLERKFGARIGPAHRYLAELGSQAGIDFQFDRAQKIPNTLKAHRLLLLAEKEGFQEKLGDRFFRAYFTEGLDLGDGEVLQKLALECGLPQGEVARWLSGSEGEGEVREAEEAAYRAGIHAVPHFVIGGTRLSGAQPPEALAQAILEELGG